MKKHFLLLLGGAALAGAAFGLAGCVGEPVVGVGFDTGPYYYDGPWVWGHPYYHEHEHWAGSSWGGYRGGWGGRHR